MSKRFTCKEFCNIFSNLENIVRKNGPKIIKFHIQTIYPLKGFSVYI